jgi:hypothetical protein
MVWNSGFSISVLGFMFSRAVLAFGEAEISRQLLKQLQNIFLKKKDH